MKRIISTIIVPAMILMPVYVVASEIDTNEQTDEASVSIGSVPTGVPLSISGAEAGETHLSLNYTGAGSYRVPGELGEYKDVKRDIGIAPSETLKVDLDTEEMEEGESGSNLTTWIIVGVLAAVAAIVIILALPSTSVEPAGG
ncbi:MAG: PEGA domain-containing protein [bacterium]|nr:PEGA domain-containing protein [bacterium]